MNKDRSLRILKGILLDMYIVTPPGLWEISTSAQTNSEEYCTFHCLIYSNMFYIKVHSQKLRG